MSTLFALAWMSGGLAILLCLTFVAFSVVKMAQLLRVHDTVRQLHAAASRAPEPPPDRAMVADKVIEASAKLTDSLAKAPMPVVAVVTAIIFMALAILAAYLGRAPVPAAAAAPSAIAAAVAGAVSGPAAAQVPSATPHADKPARGTQ
jgi:hypothetical protein